jgi:fructose 1,6-bisphosphate aldolase/phosphatase
MMKTTISVIKADVGGYPGHSSMHPALMEIAKRELAKHKGKTLIDYCVLHCGDDLELIMTHTKGVDNKEIHKIAWDVFKKGTEEAKKLKLYGAGQDMLKDTFSGNVKGMGPGVAEMTFEERKSDPVMIYMADKTEPGAWNYALYKMFADPFSSIGLIIDQSMHEGFTFEVHDLFEHKKMLLKCPAESYDLLALIGQPSRYVIKHVFRTVDKEIAAATSTQRLSLIAGRYVGKDDPVMIVRCQSGFPAVGEALEPFSFPYAVAGWMRGSHHGPFMPVGFDQATPSRFDGPPRVICAGFQIADGRLEGPSDMFKDVSFDRCRQKANEIADYFRRHGPFEPHRLSAEEMEYTTLAEVLKKLAPRMTKLSLKSS